MTLTLIGDPGSGNIVQTPSGLIVLRAEDYVGPARATLTTVADTDSVSGLVVKETQGLVVPSTISAAGTGTSVSVRWPLASDTLRIPVAAIDPFLPSTNGFYIMAGIKVAGTTPTNARYKETWGHFRQATCAAAWGRDSTLHGSAQLWTSVFGNQYRLTDRFSYSWSSISSATDLTFRIWGVTGGTMEYSIDLIYIVPWGSLRVQYFGSGYVPFQIGQNGTLFVDQDDDNTDNSISGSQSVTMGNVVQEPWSAPTPMDLQEANDEPTLYDISDGSWGALSGNPVDPKTYLIIPVMPHYIPAATIIDDDFTSGATGMGLFVDGPQGYVKANEQGNFTGPGHSSGINGWHQNATQLVCNLPANQTGGYPHAQFIYGYNELILGESSTDPRNYSHTIHGLEDLIIETDFAADTTSELYFLTGFHAYNNGVYTEFTLLADGYSAKVYLEGGALKASIIHADTSFQPAPVEFSNTHHEIDGPITLDASYSVGDRWHIKFERRRYHLRARFWADGDSEPSTWDLEGYMSFRFRNSANTVRGFIDHPYDTNWAGDVDHDITSRLPWEATMSIPGLVALPGLSQGEMSITVESFKVSCDPHGASVVDMFLQEENYDGTSPSNTLTIPYGTVPSARMVEGSLRKRHFGSDANGFNLRAWKDGASPELQLSGLPILWELGVVPRRRPQIYRRLYG